jgi:hypothetical protein
MPHGNLMGHTNDGLIEVKRAVLAMNISGYQAS